MYETVVSTTLPASTVNNGLGGISAFCAAPADLLLTGSCAGDAAARVTESRAYNFNTTTAPASWACTAYNTINASGVVSLTARVYCVQMP